MPTKENSSLPLLISPRLEGENNREYAYRVLRAEHHHAAVRAGPDPERGGTERKAGNEPYPGA